MALYRCSSPSGGGGGSYVGGTTEATVENTSLTINTGLSSISQFVWFATQAANNKQCVITYDSNMGNYFTVCVPATNAGNFKRAIGSAPIAQVPALTSITGGTVVLAMATSSGFGNVNTGYWFAC